MINIGNVQLLNCIHCEEVRLDATGKHFLIGVTPGGLAVPSFPANVPMSLYMEFQPLEKGAYQLEMEFSGPGPGRGGMKIGMEVESTIEPVAVFTPRLELAVSEPGIQTLKIRPNGGRWVTVSQRRFMTVEEMQARIAGEQQAGI